MEKRSAKLARQIIVAVLVAVSAGAFPEGTSAQNAGPPGAPSPATPAAPVPQNNGGIMSLPQKLPGSRYTGLRIAVDPRWTNTFGYRPVEVTVTALKASPVDRLLTIQLHAGWSQNIGAEKEFVLPAQQTSVTAEISMPLYQVAQNSYWWDLWVDGAKDKDLSIDRQDSIATWGVVTSTGGTSLTFLVAGTNANHRKLVSTNSLELQVLSLELSKFPTQWIDYSALDVVSLSLDEAQQLATSNPAAFESLERWAHAGGQLWIGNVGKNLEHLPDVSKLFKVADGVVDDDENNTAEDSSKETKYATSKDEKAAPADRAQPVVKNGWRSIRFRQFGGDGQVVTFLDPRTNTRRTVRDPESIARMQSDPNLITAEQRPDAGGYGGRRRGPVDTSEWFVSQNLGLGKVWAFRGENEVRIFASGTPTSNANGSGGADTPDELARSLAVGLRRTQRWDTRHGMTPDSANTEFSKFLIPDVGTAPVTEFRVLITLFVLLIGPVNYWFLKRAKRLQLMVLTVPLAAAITTSALFAYAILADGFDTRVRAHTFTSLDQRTGEAACWSRLSYYSGLAPGHGLAMPADVALFPILPAWGGDLSAWEKREIVWSDGAAQLKQGWLNSRTPTQYLSIRSRKSLYKIEVLDSGDKVRIKNGLGTKIKTLVMLSEANKFYLGEAIDADSSAILKPLERDEAIRIINKQIADNTPQSPPELAMGESDMYALRSRGRNQPYWRYGVQSNTGKLSENLANTALSNLAGLSGQPALDLPPRSYVAITETGPEVELGIPYAIEDASFHVIEGHW